MFVWLLRLNLLLMAIKPWPTLKSTPLPAQSFAPSLERLQIRMNIKAGGRMNI